MLDFLISPAYAQAAAPASTGMFNMIFIPLMLVIFYFMLIRPQMKRTKEHREMLDKVAKGDEVVASGGLAGKVMSIGEAYLTVEIADGVAVKIQKQAITSVLPKGTLKNL